MIKRLLSLMILAVLIAACGSTGEENKSQVSEESINIEFASLIESPADFLNKEIVLDGNVVHVCKHSGKKMFIVGEDPDIRLHVSAGGDIPVFPMELLGSDVTVTGVLTEVIIAEEEHSGEHAGEGEHSEDEADGEAAEGEDCETEAALKKQPVLATYILEYKSHTVK